MAEDLYGPQAARGHSLNTEQVDGATDRGWARRFRNSYSVIPLRLFLAGLFMFAGYAKLSYPRYLDPNSVAGFKASIASTGGSPLYGALRPLRDHPSLFGHITAYAEIAIGLGLLVGLLTRIAALGGMVLTALIALSVNWNSIKEYTGSGGWFTSVDLAVAAALSIFLIGGAGPISLDAGYSVMRRRRRLRHDRDDGEPGFRDNELDESRARLQGWDGQQHTTQMPSMPAADASSTAAYPAYSPPGASSAPSPAAMPADAPTGAMPAAPPAGPVNPASPPGPVAGAVRTEPSNEPSNEPSDGPQTEPPTEPPNGQPNETQAAPDPTSLWTERRREQ